VAYSLKDRKLNFYILGSMGLVSSVGLGLAMNCSNKVFIIDGDGSLLMDLGIMPMIGASKCKNLIHVVLDNNAYCSTGNQRTYSNKVDLATLAKISGYSKVVKINSAKSWGNFLNKIYLFKGPVFCLIRIERNSVEDLPRVAIKPEDMTRRFRRYL
jgi:thiamine pyrophosphate-dependent acetolactate synthase large subunit-like protein